MKRFFLILLFLLAICPRLAAQTPLWQGKGRIVISSDGNAHDEDDWGAVPVMMAILAAKGLQNCVPLFIYSDHIWEGCSDRAGYSGYDEMQKSVMEGKWFFGFDGTEFICAFDNPETAYNAVSREINRSTKRNPLILIAAGPMQVLGEGISRAKPSRLRYVTLITHGRWNNIHCGKDVEKYKNPHEGWSYKDVVDSFSSGLKNGLTCMHIHDQNGRDTDSDGNKLFEGLYVKKQQFDWMKTSESRLKSPYKKGSWEWLHSRMEICAKDGNRNFDVSDAGMLIYVLTGSDYTSPEMLKDLLEHPVQDTIGKQFDAK